MALKLTGRDEECVVLKGLFESGRPEFLALYGRRRVGKTFLIREFFANKKVIFFNITGSRNGKLQEQIDHFMQQVGRVFLGGAVLKPVKTWDDAFMILTDFIESSDKKKKVVLFFDELPWMATKRSRLLSTLDYYWNQYWSSIDRVKLIICGSSASWIINKVINSTGGLHNRITCKMHLEPFNLANTKKFLKKQGVRLNNKQITQIYMVTGGVAYYLTYIDKNLSASQAIEKIAFRKGSFLLEEFDNLFASLFNNYQEYIEIIRIISKCRSGIGQNKLLEEMGRPNLGCTGLNKLNDLENAGFIMSFKPSFHKTRGIYYRVVDEYTLFYLHWIEPIRNTLQVRSLEPGNWQHMQNSAQWYSWSGYAFEAICYKHISQIRKKLEISPIAIANSWRYSPRKSSSEAGAQIDLLFDRMDDSITICEIKYSDKTFVIDKQYAKNLLNKKDVFVKRTRTKKQIFIVMIASNGVKNNLYADDLISAQVTLDDLFL
jgi:uncharacterized protein